MRKGTIAKWVVSLAATTAVAYTVVGCVTDKQVISSAVQANSQLEPAEMTDPELSNYLQTLGNRIIASAKQADAAGLGPPTHTDTKEDSSWMFSNQMQFHFVNSKTVNAFTTGGQHMYVYNALFQMCETEDELTAVMSHEFAHVYCRHIQESQKRQYGMLAAAGLAGAAGYVAGGKENGATYASTAAGGALALTQFVGMGFTRSDEAQADEYGFAFYSLAGWDPDHFPDFFQRMIDAGYDKTPEWQSDHPTLASRVQAAKQRAATWKQKHGDTRKPDTANPQQFAAYKAKAAKIAASMPDDSSLQGAQQLLASFSSCVSPKDGPEVEKARQDIITRAQAEKAAQDKAAQQSQKTSG